MRGSSSGPPVRAEPRPRAAVIARSSRVQLEQQALGAQAAELDVRLVARGDRQLSIPRACSRRSPPAAGATRGSAAQCTSSSTSTNGCSRRPSASQSRGTTTSVRFGCGARSGARTLSSKRFEIVERRGDRPDQQRRIVVAIVELDPAERSPIGVLPLGEDGGLAVARRGRQQGSRGVHVLGAPRYDLRPIYQLSLCDSGTTEAVRWPSLGAGTSPLGLPRHS